MKKASDKAGHAIITYKVRLYDRHFQWLQLTKELYDKTAEHFFMVLQKEPALLEQSDFLLLRALEVKCIGTKEMKTAGVVPEYPLTGFPRIPLYFRRSAINAAIALARKKNTSGKEYPMTVYKGMYREFKEHSIELNLFNGKGWAWVNYPFNGRNFPDNAERMSPILVLEKGNAYLNVPLEKSVQDIRTVKERIIDKERICAVAFPDYDVLAAAVILTPDGEEQAHCFFRGGNRKEYQKKQVLKRIEESRKSRGKEWQEGDNLHLYEHLKEINNYYAHSISKQLVEYCQKQDVRIIVVPHYENELDFSDKQYLKTNNYRWLGRAIIKKLRYKAFYNGIVVTSVRPYHISDHCCECGAVIRKYNEGHTAGANYHGGKLFLCPNGHGGNTAQNAACNLGRNFLSYYQKGS